jgi:succinyl-CoA synthetase alpha subunit
MNSTTSPFKYHVGIRSLADIATRADRVCVLNILGSESKSVTPVSHAFSGANVVFGTSPGRGGQVLPTRAGDIPVFDNVRAGLEAGHRFNSGVVYLPPSAARDGVAELIRVNPELEKIFIVTEKISVHDAREIRALGQHAGVDIFGANSLGVADAWNRVRIGGALGGDEPDEVLRAGSIAVCSNSGGFSNTIAQYLLMKGWGTSTILSTGKDVYIHFGAAEFAHALAHDVRSKAAVLYCEPGGYYEHEMLLTKPTVACVVGRWKSRLTRAVGHAGALAGPGDDALAKERWFQEMFAVDGNYTPERPVFSAKGAVVTNIAHIPEALDAVMRANGEVPDFSPSGHLSLKPWFASSRRFGVPARLDLPAVKAMAPYDEQIQAANRRIGVTFPRQSMKDASGASAMDPSTQISSLYDVTTLAASELPVEAQVCLALTHDAGHESQWGAAAVGILAFCNLRGKPELLAAAAAREAGNAPNAVLAAALCLVGPAKAEPAREAVRVLIDAFSEAGLQDADDPTFDVARVERDVAARLTGPTRDEAAEQMLAALHHRGVPSAFVRWAQQVPGHLTSAGALACIALTLAWPALMRKRISRMTAENLPWWLMLYGTAIGASAAPELHGEASFCGFDAQDLLRSKRLDDVALAALLGRPGEGQHRIDFSMLCGLLLTNGPGAVSAQGAKGAVSADGPEQPGRVQLNKALVGSLTHTGFAHGGNGFEGVSFLLEQFREVPLRDPGDPHHTLDLKAMARACAERYLARKQHQRDAGTGGIAKIPGVNHPVFKGKPVNHDPRERHVARLNAQRGQYNVFHAYYLELVQALFDTGASKNVYCVNVDAVIAATLLKMMWPQVSRGGFKQEALEHAAFTMFLYPRLLGCAAEIDDHLNRGRDLDTRTAASLCTVLR